MSPLVAATGCLSKMMKWTVGIVVAASIGLAGCDPWEKERKANEAIYKANDDAARQCEAKLRGLKRVPIARTGGKLFLDAERLPMWQVSRAFRVGDECAVDWLGQSAGFYWTGETFIPHHILLIRDRHSLVEAEEQHKDWITIYADVFFGIPGTCESTPENRSLNCGKPPPNKEKVGVIRLKNHPLDAWPVRDRRQSDKPIGYVLSLRDWPKENGWPRLMSVSCALKELDSDKIENLNFNDSRGGICVLDFTYFKFKAGSALITFAVKDMDRITPVLKAFQQYLNESIIEEAQP